MGSGTDWLASLDLDRGLRVAGVVTEPVNEMAAVSMSLQPLYLLINLDRSPERLETTGTHLSARGIAYRRLRGVDGNTLTLRAPAVLPSAYRRYHGRTLRAAEVGCYLSHLSAMETFLASAHDYCVVLEDDVEVVPDFAEAVADLVANDLYDYDLVRLQGRRRGLGVRTHWAANDRSVEAMITRVTGSTAYILNRGAARKCLAQLIPMVVPFDHAYDRPLHLGLKIGHILPYPAQPARGWSSTIDAPRAAQVQINDADKVGFFEKLPVLAWRTGTEVGRAMAALGPVLRWRMWHRLRRRLPRPALTVGQIVDHSADGSGPSTPAIG